MRARLDAWLEHSSIRTGITLILATLLVGYLDYETGPNILMTAFYVVPLSLAAWTMGFGFASLLSLLAVGIWMTGNTLNGDATFSNVGLMIWNCATEFALFMFVAFSVDRLRQGQRQLETRVRERTAALEQLQRELLESSEREQRRIGQDLHDGLCQHLAGAAYLCHALHEELEESGSPEARNAGTIVELIKEGVALARQTAKGLDPVEMDAEGLMHALKDFAASSSRLYDVSCRFDCDSPVLISNPAAANNLFRIAQEAVRNAIAHGQAKNIRISLHSGGTGTDMKIEDDGMGLGKAPRSGRGMGLMIMPRRASRIGATFAAGAAASGGTIVSVHLPARDNSRVETREQTGR
jgi:signal transduction histidine kinase